MSLPTTKVSAKIWCWFCHRYRKHRVRLRSETAVYLAPKVRPYFRVTATCLFCDSVSGTLLQFNDGDAANLRLPHNKAGG